MNKNCQVIFTGPKQVELQETAMPEPGKGMVLIRTILTQISIGTELTMLTGDYPPESTFAKCGKFPFHPGYSNIGRIVDVGEGVDRGLIGKIVATSRCHAHYVVGNSSGNDLIFVPDGLKLEEAIFYTIAFIVMNGVRLAKIEPGEAIGIFGLGLLGQLAVQFCRFCGGWPVVAVDPSEFRRALAKQGNADYCLDPTETGFMEKMKEISKGRMFDVIFEITGMPDAIKQQMELLRERGREIILSSPRGKSLLDFHDLVNRPSRQIIGAHSCSQPKVESLYNQWTKARNIELFFELLKAGKFRMAHLISHRYRWDNALDAYQMLMKDRTRALGVQLYWDDDSCKKTG